MRFVNLLCVALLVGCSAGPDGSMNGNQGAGGGGGTSGGTGGNGDNGGNPDMALAGGGGGGGGGGDNGGGGGTGGGGGGGALLKFAVFGDCRPPNVDDTSGYPSSVISGIFKLAQSKGAQFAIGTGDYMFASQASAVTAQVALFQQAAANFTAGPLYLTMGNHECTGYTASNCPNLNETPNIQAFMKMVPSGVTKPYYRIDVNTPLGTAKFIFIAANAWDSTQQSWLTTQLGDATTYTFVARHEPSTSSGVPTGVTASESIVGQHPYTIELLGHTHEYRHEDTQHVISGNAGAPLSSGSYGLLMVEQLANGNISVTEIDESTGNATDTWTVSPTGQKM
jgi:predicted phosphodiesterase